jgi:hypothetical protein
MEARPKRDGGFSFRYLSEEGPKINLGNNYEEAISRYETIVAPSGIGSCDPLIAAEEIWKRHRKGAKQRGKEFAITIDDVLRLLESQKNRCAVTGIRFNNAKPKNARMRPWAPSLDRIRSNEGYVNGNVRLVCAFANVAMNDFGEEILMTLLEKIVRRTMREEVLSALKSLGYPVQSSPDGNF